MREFVDHGEACSKLEVEALSLAGRDIKDVTQEDDPLQPYYEILECLGENLP
jgi:hypothetical protein